jgi:hypothetical protein
VITNRHLEGRTRGQKREPTILVGEEVPRTVTTPPDDFHAIFEGEPRTDWGRGGVLLADRGPR